MTSTIVSRRGRVIGAALVFLALVSCGGGGGSSTPPTPPSKLFISDGGNHAIGSVINAAPSLGSTFTIDRIVEGSNTGLGLSVGGAIPTPSTLPSIALDATNDRLYVSTQFNVLVFNNISTASGNIAFSRRFQATGVNFLGLSLDTKNDLLYTVDPNGVVNVFNGASGLNNTVTPTRTLTPDFGASTIATTFGIAVDNTANDLLYVGMALNGATSIFVYNNASTVFTTTTPKAPDQNLNFTFGLTSFFLDIKNDRLYAAQANGIILVFDHASTLTTGTPPPNRTIDMMDVVGHFIFVDTSRDKLYAVGNNIGGSSANHDLLILNNASTADDAAITPPVVLGVPIQDSSIALSAIAVEP